VRNSKRSNNQSRKPGIAVEEWNSQGGEEQCGTVKEARNSLGSEKLSRKRRSVNEVGTVKKVMNSQGCKEQSWKSGPVKEARHSQ
jgi:hypothetical protein